MKKYFVLLMALMMLISTFMGSFAQANLFEREPKKVDEVICALVGGVAAGVIAHNVVGKDPVTFIAALIGGAIGNDYCKNYVNNAEYQAIKDLMNGGLGPKNGPRIVRRENSQFLAAFTIYNHGSRNSRGDSGTYDQCVQFDASVWKKINSNSANDRFMGNTGRYWACQNGNSDFEIVRGSSGIYIDNAVSTSTTVGGGSGSGSIGGGISASAVSTWARLDFKQIAVGFRVEDVGTKEKRAVYIRTRAREGGFFAGTGTTQMGTPGVKMAIDTATVDSGRNSGVIIDEDQVAIECDVLPYCQSFKVENFKFNGMVLNGRAMYIFKNGDMIVMDQENGRVIVPLKLLVR